MAASKDHIALANKNHNALLHLLDDAGRFPEWVATIAFYKAVHVVEAVFRQTLGKNCTTHQQRLAQLKHPKFEEIFKDYRPLWAASCVARYLHDNDGNQAYKTFDDYIPSDKATSLL